MIFPDRSHPPAPGTPQLYEAVGEGTPSRLALSGGSTDAAMRPGGIAVGILRPPFSFTAPCVFCSSLRESRMRSWGSFSALSACESVHCDGRPGVAALVAIRPRGRPT